MLHLVHRFDTGGLENGVVNLINHMPAAAYRHAVVALTEITDFRHRVQRDDVVFHALHKPPGQAVGIYPRFLRLLSELRPAVLHTRNLGTLEFQLLGAMTRVPARVHGEHGRDIDDLDGSSRRHRWIRRVYRPFVGHYVALSRDLEGYLADPIGVPATRITQIYNGVDLRRFHPSRVEGNRAVEGFPFASPGLWVIGTVGRMQLVKAQTLLAQAFVQALQRQPGLRATLRLVMVGSGPLRDEVRAILQSADALDLSWLPGDRRDVPDLMRTLDCFALPSLAEGVSNTILEAMATALPVVATAVGANAELVVSGETGEIVPPGNAEALCDALLRLVADPGRARDQGLRGRSIAIERFSIESMVAAYAALYDRMLGRNVASV